MEELEDFYRFVFVSSYSIHGPRNPYRDLDPLTGDTPVNPGDNYGKHKVAVEKRLEKSDIDWVVIRLSGVFSVDSDFGATPEFRKFGFLLDPNRNQSAIDARDAGLAIANAVTADALGRKFDICGDPSEGWAGKAAKFTGALMNARGLGAFPQSAYRLADPNVDESWYYEDIADPTESEKILKYQRHSFEDYLKFIRKQSGYSRYIIKLLSPILKRILVRESPYHGKEEFDKKPIWEEIKKQFDIDETKLKLFNNQD